ncbi:MupG family TIM beta-alpha barrel fold protein [Lactobacillus sp. ESL0684]|uniref:DUF871 domain-containing protein n=1 Tax=unclassified Lactobacillus TaxID=2620435 RepID=UPI0023F7949D|nr:MULTISPECIES: MupG family TIM beta-alpha barrel fold protein [unclassified Lactobacillus]WEV39538.1 MupG family TIM beta-alpha barrel fold protein [Lactobacillus sp. ESL0681]WEV43946.1 MupG family TIM beta-alpha barrel fold protein [Lactobacillus sp. ESL0684]
MLGFSMYLGRDLTAQDYNYLLAMHNAGFATVFTSLQIPEDDAGVVLTRLGELTKWCKNLDIDIVADVSQEGLARMGLSLENFEQIQQLNLTGLRIDDGVDASLIAKLSRSMPIALNASTITSSEITALREHGADFDHLQAWHNYYPRPESGLDANWFKQKNAWLHKQNLQTMGFIGGDSTKRGPIYAGLPTLEKQRGENPLAAMLELQQLNCDHVFVGDAALSSEAIASFTDYLKNDTLTLHLAKELPELSSQVWHNRPDVARDVVRLVEGRKRQSFDVTPQSESLPRPIGTITCDNSRYLRYQGELQITKKDLPADERVNVLGRVVTADLPILAQIDAGRRLTFKVAKN